MDHLFILFLMGFYFLIDVILRVSFNNFHLRSNLRLMVVILMFDRLVDTDFQILTTYLVKQACVHM